MDNQVSTFVGNAKTLEELLLQQPDLAYLNKPTITAFAAQKYGKKFAEGVRPSLAALKAMGVSAEQLKVARKEHDVVVHNYHRNVRAVTAILNSSDNLRQTIKAGYDAKGNAKFDVSYRWMSEASLIKMLTQRIADLTARVQVKDPVANALPAKATVKA